MDGRISIVGQRQIDEVDPSYHRRLNPTETEFKKWHIPLT